MASQRRIRVHGTGATSLLADTCVMVASGVTGEGRGRLTRDIDDRHMGISSVDVVRPPVGRRVAEPYRVHVKLRRMFREIRMSYPALGLAGGEGGISYPAGLYYRGLRSFGEETRGDGVVYGYKLYEKEKKACEGPRRVVPHCAQ